MAAGLVGVVSFSSSLEEEEDLVGDKELVIRINAVVRPKRARLALKNVAGELERVDVKGDRSFAPPLKSRAMCIAVVVVLAHLLP